jgi:hypothetical protein
MINKEITIEFKQFEAGINQVQVGLLSWKNGFIKIRKFDILYPNNTGLGINRGK